MEVCLVGAGPRGLSVLERICAQERRAPGRQRIVVHVVDPGPPGSGQVWRADQPRHLLMNTVASQVTVYTDASVRIAGPLEEGPSLHQWAKALGPSALTAQSGQPYDDETLAEARDLGPDTYSTRALYGQYLNWVFRQVVANAPVHVTVRVHPQRAVALDGTATQAQAVTLQDGTRLNGLSAVVLAQGHVPAHPTTAVRRLTAFAADHSLTYIPPANPADVDLSAVAPGESVLLRGLGLNFFDYMALFTHARGGVFRRESGRLVYHPSGREPRLYAGSRRGVPYQARGENQKGAHGRYLPRLLTVDRITALRGAPGKRRLRFRRDLWPLIDKEVRSVYYEALLAGRDGPDAAAAFADRYLRADPGPAEDALLDAACVAPGERWDWDRVAAPLGTRDFADPADFRAWLLDHLGEDLRQARAGNVGSALKAALDVLRDLRNEIRLGVDHGGLDAASHRDELDGWYTRFNAHLSIGPPASRVEEMAALIEAGILDVVGPGLQVSTAPDGPCFVATSSRVPGVRARATAMIESRLPDIDLRRTADPLMRQLLRTGQCRPYRVPGGPGEDCVDSGYETGGLDVTERPYRLRDAQGLPHPRRFAYGVPTESVHWVTAAGIRPGVGSVTLEDSDAIAAAVLALPEPGSESGERDQFTTEARLLAAARPAADTSAGATA